MKIVHQAFHGYEQRPHLLKLGFGDAGTVVEVEVVQVAVLREIEFVVLRHLVGSAGTIT